MLRKDHIDWRQSIREWARMREHSLYKNCVPALKELFYDCLVQQPERIPSLPTQLKLLRSLISIEDGRKKYELNRQRFGRARKHLADSGADLERIKVAHARQIHFEECVNAAVWIRQRMRSIGDAIAWRLVDYDRFMMRMLVEHDHVGVPEVGKGLLSELGVLNEVTNRGHPAILNSITNFLRAGDITVRDPQTGRTTLIEVKSSAVKGARFRRQAHHIREVQVGLSSGTHTLAGPKLTRLAAGSRLGTYVRSVEQALKTALVKGGSSRLWGDYLSVGVFHMPTIFDRLSSQEGEQIRTQVMDRIMNVGRHGSDLILDWVNVFSLTELTRPMVPYGVYPIEPELRFGLVVGDFVVFSLLNVHGLARWLTRRGMPSRVLPWPEDAESISRSRLPFRELLETDIDGATIYSGPDRLMVAASEFWTPESIQASLAAVRGQPSAGHHVVVFPVNPPWD